MSNEKQVYLLLLLFLALTSCATPGSGNENAQNKNTQPASYQNSNLSKGYPKDVTASKEVPIVPGEVEFFPLEGSPLVIRVDERSLSRFTMANELANRNEMVREARQIETQLVSSGVTCCPPRRRMGRCIWVCCDGRKVRTCDKRIIAALELLWGE